MKVLVIGAGAAGCFCAIRLKRAAPEVSVTVLEAGRTALAKVAVTGGGRCNLTNSFEGIRSLQEAYPRGHRLIERAFRLFGPKETMRWFEDEGVRLVLQEDHCVFPASQDAMEIVQTLLRGMREAGVELRTGCRVKQVLNEGNGYKVLTDNEVFPADAVVVTTGGSPRRSGIAFLDGLDIETVDPVPSLFSFNIEVPALRALMGLVVPAAVSLPGTKFRAAGPLLITDWGLSGPAVSQPCPPTGTPSRARTASGMSSSPAAGFPSTASIQSRWKRKSTPGSISPARCWISMRLRAGSTSRRPGPPGPPLQRPWRNNQTSRSSTPSFGT